MTLNKSIHSHAQYKGLWHQIYNSDVLPFVWQEGSLNAILNREVLFTTKAMDPISGLEPIHYLKVFNTCVEVLFCKQSIQLNAK